MEKQRKILVIEDHEIVVWALRVIIEENFPDTTIFSAASLEQGLRALEENRIDLIILDIDIPGGNSPKMISRLRELRPAVRVLIHSALEEGEYALRYLAAGANGFLSKNTPLTALPEAVRLTLNDKNYFGEVTKQAIAEKFISDPYNRRSIDSEALLSNRELSVARLLLQGKWTKEIAEELGIKLNTVSTHKQNIFEKLNVDNVIELYKKVEKELPQLLE
jgi:two-component system invasion response regulator UvrY